jgi:hypothetical protein
MNFSKPATPPMIANVCVRSNANHQRLVGMFSLIHAMSPSISAGMGLCVVGLHVPDGHDDTSITDVCKNVRSKRNPGFTSVRRLVDHSQYSGSEFRQTFTRAGRLEDPFPTPVHSVVNPVNNKVGALIRGCSTVVLRQLTAGSVPTSLTIRSDRPLCLPLSVNETLRISMCWTIILTHCQQQPPIRGQ